MNRAMPSLDAALSLMLLGLYHRDCLECSARALAGSPAYHAAAMADAITPDYRDALQAVYGEEWREWHLRVKAWAKGAKS